MRFYTCCCCCCDKPLRQCLYGEADAPNRRGFPTNLSRSTLDQVNFVLHHYMTDDLLAMWWRFFLKLNVQNSRLSVSNHQPLASPLLRDKNAHFVKVKGQLLAITLLT